jgi:hypothetical protein
VEKGQSLTPGNIVAADSDGGEADLAMPKLKYVSTRRIGPLRDFSYKEDMAGRGLSLGLVRGYRRAGMDTIPDIFDELDKV